PEEGVMPAGHRRMLLDWISNEIEATSVSGNRGRVVLRRLNRVEYQNTMSDLLGIETDYAANLPPEGLSEE
ncbi:MAG: DUF1587 domain-containing protein, partial [Rubripirellula sp.]